MSLNRQGFSFEVAASDYALMSLSFSKADTQVGNESAEHRCDIFARVLVESFQQKHAG
jgi:hypothetical protein